MKKLLSILLTLALILSLSAPALAAAPEETPGISIDEVFSMDVVFRDSGYPMDADVAAWLASHPEETAALAASLDQWAETSWGHGSVAEMAEVWGESEAYIRDLLLEERAREAMEQEVQEEDRAAYAAAHPGYLDGFDPAAWLRTAYPDYKDPEAAFMADYGLTDRAAFEDYMKDDYTHHLIWMEELRADIDTALAEDPAALEGFDVNAYFAQEYFYYESQKAFMADCTLLDQTEFETYLTWEYLTHDALLGEPGGEEPLGGVPGELGVMVNGAYLTFEGDKPYAEDGVTYVPAAALGEALGLSLTGDYVPLRETAAAAGCDVWWDPGYHTAVVLDPDALAETIDGGFTAINGLMAKSAPAWERWKSTEDWKATLTLFDTLNGDKTYPMTLTQESLYGPEGGQTTGEYDLSALMTLLERLGLTEDAGAEVEQAAAALLSGNYELCWDLETGTMAVTASALPELLSLAGLPVSGELWFTQGGETAAELYAGLEDLMDPSEPPTVGTLVWYLYENSTAAYTDPVCYWSETLDLAGTIALFLGDDALVREGKTWVLRLGMEDLAALLGYSEEDYGYLGLQDFALEYALGDDGSFTGSLLCLSADENWSPAIRVAASWDSDRTGGTVEAEFHIKNQMKLLLTVTTATEETDRRPETQAPEGAAALALEDLPAGEPPSDHRIKD